MIGPTKRPFTKVFGIAFVFALIGMAVIAFILKSNDIAYTSGVWTGALLIPTLVTGFFIRNTKQEWSLLGITVIFVFVVIGAEALQFVSRMIGQ